MTILQAYYLGVELLMLATIIVCVYLIAVEIVSAPRPEVRLRKVGGLYHWRMGRMGGSFYISKGY